MVINDIPIVEQREIKIYHDAGASIRDEETTFINRHSVNEDICHGLALEIMPIDGCPKGTVKRFFQLMWAMTFALFNAQRLPDNKGKVYRMLAGCIYKVISKPRGVITYGALQKNK